MADPIRDAAVNEHMHLEPKKLVMKLVQEEAKNLGEASGGPSSRIPAHVYENVAKRLTFLRREDAHDALREHQEEVNKGGPIIHGDPNEFSGQGLVNAVHARFKRTLRKGFD